MRLDLNYVLIAFSLFISLYSRSVSSLLEERTTRLAHFLFDSWSQIVNSTREEFPEFNLEKVFDFDVEDDATYSEENWELETKKDDQETANQDSNEPIRRRNFLRLSNRVFSRVELPEVFRPPKGQPGSFCLAHIGCLDEAATLPSILRWGNVSASFIVYTSAKPKGVKIVFEPVTHYQLEDANMTVEEIQEKFNSSQLPHQLTRSGSAGFGILQPQHPARPFRLTARSWQSAAKVKRKQEYPFDLGSMESCGFNSSQNTRIIIGGYFAKEDEKWINEVVRNWQKLEPANIIKVSWADSNRGLYHSAAFNSRIVGRQLTLFLYYLDQMYGIDLGRFHLVGHSLGAHIAGFVGADNEGRIARITGLDPAGPIFAEFDHSLRLDSTDAEFVDIVHTNGGSLTRGALGISTPLGHVDYYPNGGAVQPGCYTAAALVDPVERVACNHRRSYRYFIEILKMTVAELGNNRTQTDANQDHAASSKRPLAFLFEAKQDELDKLTQPELSCLREENFEIEWDNRVGGIGVADKPALRRQVEFHRIKPDGAGGRRGLYIFRTLSEAPYFGELILANNL